jgi:predicted DCC family thiol-disulfide oxidoreductase YuxK
MTKEVLYNGQCPICAPEVAVYARDAQAVGADMAFTDLNQTDLTAWGLDADSAARRLHLRDSDGHVLAGVPAFIALWSAIPRWRWLARLVALPVIRTIAGLVYDHILAPVLYTLHKRRKRD